MSDPTRTAHYLLTQSRMPSPRVPPIAELAELARSYLATHEDGATLAAQGVVYVSYAAADSYARSEGIEIEEARRELTELLADAKQSQSDPGKWRFRRKSESVDITARVARDGRLLVVTAVDARSYGGR